MRTLLLILAITVYAFSYCPDFKENSPRCLRDTTVNLPTYSDGSYMKKGESVCKRDTYVETDTLQLQGVTVSVNYMTKVCRKIIGFGKVTRLDFDCCSDYAARERKYTKDSNKKPMDVYSDAYGKCIHYEYTPCVNTDGYITGYDEKYDIEYDYKDKRLFIKESPNAFVSGDTIEMFRDDGTLRYRGFVSIKNNDILITKGDCYNKSGTSKTRMTNNASLCK